MGSDTEATMSNLEIIVSPDNELKNLGNAKFGGFLVIFSDENNADLCGDFFTKSTEFFIEDGASLPILYDHGFDDDLKRQKIGVGKVTKKTEGLWLEFQLDRRAKYVTAIEKMCAAGKCGLSSGAAGHLVSRTPMKNASWISEWGLAEGSITPEPAEPRITVMPLKSYAEMRGKHLNNNEGQPPAKSLAARLTQFIDDSVDDGHPREDVVKKLAREALMDVADVEKALKGEINLRGTAHLKAFARVLNVPFETLKAMADKTESRTIKGMFEDELANQQPSVWMLWDVFRCVVKKIAEAKASTAAAGTEFDEGPKIDEAVTEMTVRLKQAVAMQIAEYSINDEDEFYLKNGFITDGSLVTEGLDFDEHSQLVVTALGEIVKRFRDNHERRKSTKAGRVLSDKNRQRLVKMLDAIQTAVTDCHGLLEETKPMANAADKHAALVNYQRVKRELQRQTIGV